MIDLASRFTRELFDRHATIFRAGDPGDSAYLIEAGQVEVLLEIGGEVRRVDVMGPGSMFGEIALLDRLPRSGTVRTLEPTALMRIDRSFVDELLRTTDPLIQYLMQLLLERVRRERSYRPATANPQASAPTPAASARVADPEPESTADSKALHAAMLRTLALSRDLSDAIDGQQFELHYQPIVHLGSGCLAGYEALVRWRHPKQGMVRPDEFIPLAERTGMIHRIGRWVLGKAIADWPQLRPMCGAEGTPFVSVNFSAPELSADSTAGSVLARLAEAGMPADELRIELTETTVIGHLGAATAVTQALRQAGVGIAMDDFGTGYAGLSYLQDLPFSCLKIDKAFVSQMLAADRSQHIVRLALELSRWMGMTTVAEGIEDEACANALREAGCTYGQGYHFAKPMTVQALQQRYSASPQGL
jgi:EAL domain-containing protein (putative c-di-GMP-specific phosphodiesterase class I)/CRP-like cAMP-binding protein